MLDSAKLLSLVPGALGSFPLFPGKTDGLAHVSYIQILDTILLAEDLGEAIKGAWEFRHDQHCLKMVRNLKPRRIASGEVCGHFVDCHGGVLVVIDLDVHGGLELEVGGNNPRFPILGFKVGPK